MNEDNGITSTMSPPPVPGVDEARAKYHEAMAGQGLNNIAIQTDRNGNSHFFGMKIPDGIRPAIEMTVGNLLPYIQRGGSEMVYNQSRSLAKKVKFSGATSNKVALVAENVFRWGLITSKQIVDVTHAQTSHARARKELFQEFAPVMDATKVQYKNNEVMKVAFDQIHHDMVTSMKMVAADIPTIIPTALFAAQDMANSSVKRKRQVHLEDDHAMLKDVAKDVEAEMQRFHMDVSRTDKLNEALHKSRAEFIKERTKSGFHTPEGQTKDAEKLGKIFDDVLAPRLREAHERRLKQHGEGGVGDTEKPNKYESMMPWVIPAATAVSQMIKVGIQDNANDQDDHMNAWKMIKHLKVELEEEFEANSRKYDHSFSTRGADEVYVNAIGTRENEHIVLKDYIVEVLQEHERDRLGIVTAEGKTPKNPLGPAMVAKVLPAVEMVAEEIANGRLDPYALVTLVGENKLIKHKKNGARQFADLNDVRKSLDELLATMSNREVVTPDEFFANFADPALIDETLKKNLGEMHGVEKAFFASLFPDDILKDAGVGREEIIELRKEAHDRMYDIVAGAVIHMAKDDQQHLHDMGLGPDDIDHITELAAKIDEGDKKALQVAVDGRDKSILNSVRTVGLNEQLSGTGDGKSFWAKRIKRAESPTEEHEQPASAQEREEKRRAESEQDADLARK